MELEINNKINNLLFNSNINKEDLDIWKEAQKEIAKEIIKIMNNEDHNECNLLTLDRIETICEKYI